MSTETLEFALLVPQVIVIILHLFDFGIEKNGAAAMQEFLEDLQSNAPGKCITRR